MRNFLNTPIEQMDFVSFDIETTGFLANDVITTFTVADGETYNAWVNTNGAECDASSTIEDIRETTGLSVSIQFASSEEELLSSVHDFIRASYSSDSTVFVAYNGERWKGGFDIPFIRTRCVLHNLPFPLKGYSYTDAQEVFGDKGRFNTTTTVDGVFIDDLRRSDLVDFATFAGVSANGNMDEIAARFPDDPSAEIDGFDGSLKEAFTEWCDERSMERPTHTYRDLCGVHSVLVGGEAGSYDPFTDSVEAVEAYEKENFQSILLHNIADVERTNDLADLMVKYTPKYEFRPTVL